MGSKDKKPVGFGVFGGTKSKATIICFVVIVVFTLFGHLYAYIKIEMKVQNEQPKLIIPALLRDVRAFVQKEKRLPKNFHEIEKSIWQPENNQSSSLSHGKNILVYKNYEYFYFYGKVKGHPVVCIWGLPLGRYRDSYQTVLLMISTQKTSLWSGPALNKSQREFILKRGFNPKLSELSELNMKKKRTKNSSSKKKGLSFF